MGITKWTFLSTPATPLHPCKFHASSPASYMTGKLRRFCVMAFISKLTDACHGLLKDTNSRKRPKTARVQTYGTTSLPLSIPWQCRHYCLIWTPYNFKSTAHVALRSLSKESSRRSGLFCNWALLQTKNCIIIIVRMSAADNTERTFLMIKPDAVHRGLIADIIKRFEQKGFKLVAMKFVKVWVVCCLLPLLGTDFLSFTNCSLIVLFLRLRPARNYYKNTTKNWKARVSLKASSSTCLPAQSWLW